MITITVVRYFMVYFIFVSLSLKISYLMEDVFYTQGTQRVLMDHATSSSSLKT